jgi:asparagine synthase (glutamine-hydrolysing)
MCGIYGKIRFDGRPASREDGERSCDALRHRGPDDHGVYVREQACLAHARLSIIDLSPLGHQPMTNEDGSRWIVFNGEIYNFQDLRPGLERKGHVFRSRSDTEVLLHLYEEEGPACVERLRGMFAFAVWDEKNRTLFLARDRVGKKPLFYYRGRDFLSFCSELRPLVGDPEIPVEVDREGIHHYLTYQSVPAPFTAYRGIRKLPPGHWLRAKDENVEIRRYWKLSFMPKCPADTPARRAELEEKLLEKIRESVRLRLVSDVPLGALLSGGVDSSGVVALMAGETAGAPVKTFSVGFHEKEYDELEYARRVASLYRTDHREFTLRPDMLSVLPLLVEHFGEPFADSAAIPTYYISQVARRHVTVALCGDGGDESFAGYHRYKLNALLRGTEFIPEFLSRGIFRLLNGLPHSPDIHSPIWIAKRFFQFLSLSPESRNLRFCSHFDGALKKDLYTPEFADLMSGIDSDEIVLSRYKETDADNLLDATLYADIHTYLPDTLLPKVDVTSMANSLEMRSPLLDHDLMEFAARLPAGWKLRRLTTKHILKKVFGHFLPRDLLARPKMGFGVPLGHWFRTDLKEMVHDTLLSPRAIGRGYFREGTVRRILDEQAQNRWHWHYHIYNLLMLELWHRRFIDRR